MRLHITLDDDLVKQLDQRIGNRQRSGFIGEAVRSALENERRWELIESAINSISPQGHDWDSDPATWVRDQRRADAHRTG